MTSRERLLTVLRGEIPDRGQLAHLYRRSIYRIILIRRIQAGFMMRYNLQKN